MPAILRQTAPAFIDKHGQVRKPKAIIATCDWCGAAAPFGSRNLATGERSYGCGWDGKEPICKGKQDG